MSTLSFGRKGKNYIAAIENQFRLNGRAVDEYIVRADIRSETGEQVYVTEAVVRVPRSMPKGKRTAFIVQKMDDSEDYEAA